MDGYRRRRGGGGSGTAGSVVEGIYLVSLRVQVPRIHIYISTYVYIYRYIHRVSLRVQVPRRHEQDVGAGVDFVLERRGEPDPAAHLALVLLLGLPQKAGVPAHVHTYVYTHVHIYVYTHVHTYVHL